MKKNQQGFTLIELTVVIVIIAIIAAIVVPTYMDMEDQSHEQTLASVVAALTTASARNYRYARLNSDKKVSVSNCTDAPSTLPSSVQMPTGYVITAAAISVNQRVNCKVTAPDGKTTATFVGIGVS